MRKNVFYTFIFAVLVLVLTSCVASVGISSWMPSEIDLTGYKTVAIQSTQQTYNYYNTFDHYVPVKNNSPSTIVVPQELQKMETLGLSIYNRRLSSVATKTITNAFNTGIYKIMGSDATDSLIKSAQNSYYYNTVRSALLQNKIDLLVTSSLDNVFYDEYISLEKDKLSDGTEVIAYYLNQRVSVVLSYTLQDVQSATVVGSDKISMSYPESGLDFFGVLIPRYETTYLGYAKADGTGYVKPRYIDFKSADLIIESLLKSCEARISKAVSPYQKNYSISLLRDPYKSEVMETANDLVSNGQYSAALQIYEEVYTKQHLFEAGYNKAVVTFALGQRDAAIKMAYDLWSSSYNDKALNLYQRFKTITDNQNKAISQITGTEKVKNKDTELIGF